MSITPAPWGAFYDKGSGEWTVASLHGCGIVCEVRGTDGEERENASLIAAAPSLLAELKDALDTIDCWWPDEFDDDDHEAEYDAQRERIVRAIKEAEGEK